MSTSTPETPLSERIRLMEYAFDYVAVRSGSVRNLADDVANLERERDEARAALSTALRERESARQAISMADGMLVQIVAERDGLRETVTANKLTIDVLEASRDAWKAKAERVCVWTLTRQSNITGRCDSECGSKNAMVWLYDPKFGYVFCPFCGGRIVKE